MKRAWRWPFAGFVVGALVGATILTVNVVGASSPERPPARDGLLRRDPAHAPAPRARGRAGRTQLRRGLRRAAGRARRRVLAEGLGLRPPDGRVDVRRASARPRARRAARPPTVPATRRAAGFDYYAEIDNGRGQSCDASRGGCAMRRSTSGRCGPGRRSTSAQPLRRGRGRRTRSPRRSPWGKGDACGRARQRPRAVADRAVGVRRRSRRLDRRARPGEPPARRSCARARSGRAAADRVRRRRGRSRGWPATGRSTCSTPAAQRRCVRSFTPAGDLIAATPLAEPSGRHGARRARAGRSCTRIRRRCGFRQGAGRPPLACERAARRRAGRAQLR